MVKVVTFGVYDYFHIGHLRLFKQCLKHGDYLIVAIQEDEFVKKNKPNCKLFYNSDQRKELLSSIKFINEVIKYKQIDETVKSLDFDVLAIGEDQNNPHFIEAEKIAIQRGKKIARLHRTPNISSTEIKNGLKQ